MVSFMHVPADRDDSILRHTDNTGYAIFATNRDSVTPVDAEGLVNRYSERCDAGVEYKIIKSLIPSIASTDYRMRFFTFVFSCLLHNMWRVVDHSLKTLASEQLMTTAAGHTKTGSRRSSRWRIFSHPQSS